jgi:hypothetical protein
MSQASHVNVANMAAQRHEINVANLNVTHSVFRIKECQDTYHQLHSIKVQLPYTSTYTSACFRNQATQASLTCLTAEEAEAIAANLAITHPVLQAMEWVDVWNRGAGHVNVTAATVKGAQLLWAAPYIQFGIEGRFLVHLTPENTTLDPTLKYSVVSSVARAESFTANSLNAHRRTHSKQAESVPPSISV